LFANYRLGLVFAERYNKQGSVSDLAAAKEHFAVVIQDNPDATEAGRARKYIASIDTVLAAQH
jgi:hypothetical protein